MQIKRDMYKDCPAYETDRFYVRLVSEADAKALLDCYSDADAQAIFNSDNCNSNFFYETEAEMLACIQFWLSEYERRYYIRFSVIEKTTSRALGTIEMFARSYQDDLNSSAGVLRLDLASKYETESVLEEILELVEGHMAKDFAVDCLVTKAVSKAKPRRQVLRNHQFLEVEPNQELPYESYFIKTL